MKPIGPLMTEHRLIERMVRLLDKEDKHFFVPVMAYFSETQQRAMLEKFWYFDRKIIHEKYKNVVEEIEKMDDNGENLNYFIRRNGNERGLTKTFREVCKEISPGMAGASEADRSVRRVRAA